MADLRCPSCGKNNPDFLDVCQFCQTPLTPESMVHTGENPVKKNTGELEPVLPQWLKDVRQQARVSAQEEAALEAAKPKVQNEPPDLLAGLASQARGDEEDIPDWLASMNPITKPAPAQPPAPAPEKDFFAQFSESKPAPHAGDPDQSDTPSWMTGATDSSERTEEKDELSEWLMKTSAAPGEAIIEAEADAWQGGAETPSFTFKEPATQPKKEEDLGWLHALEDSSREFDKPQPEPAAPTAVEPSQPPSPQQGLDPLKPLETGSETFAPMESAPSFEQNPIETSLNAASGGEDLSWLDTLGGIAMPASQEPPPAQPAAPPKDSDWVNNLGEQAVTPFQEKPIETGTDWLKTIQEPPGKETPTPTSPFLPRRTAPLGEETPQDFTPDWLKSATEEPSMPAPGALLDWFRQTSAPPSTPSPLDPTQDKLASPPSNLPSSSSGSAPLSNQEVDSLFSVEMPDWLSRHEPGAGETPTPAQPGALPADPLAPANLPSWVQSMRPVESVIAETLGSENQNAESEGPLAGLQGVIPVAPIGSSRRPKAVSLKLQASDEQQAGAALLEKILAGETNPRPILTQTNVKAQRVLRWALAGLFMVVLGTMAYLRTEFMPVSAAIPDEVAAAAGAIAGLPQDSLVLVVIDYEPALAAEMEAVSGPMLDQLVLTTRARLAFLSTSPNGTALARRLLTNTGIGVPAPNGLGYTSGENYVNLGLLAGGYSGVREFIESPNTAIPQTGGDNFSVATFLDYAAVLVLTDHAESGRVWVEQLYAHNQADAALFSVQPILLASSAQAGPMLQPYFSSRQIAGMVSGLADAARYEFINNSRPGIARRYWDSFGVGLLMATVSILLGSLWSLFSALRARRMQEEG